MEREKEAKVGRRCRVTNRCHCVISSLMHQVFCMFYLQPIWFLILHRLAFFFFQSFQRTSFVFMDHLYYIFISTSLISAHLCHLLPSTYFGFLLSTPLPCNFKLQNSKAGRRQDLALPSHFIKRPRILQLETELPHSPFTASHTTTLLSSLSPLPYLSLSPEEKKIIFLDW